MIKFLATIVMLLGFAGAAHAACNVPNPNLLGPPFVDGCPLPAAALNKFGFATSGATGILSGAAGAVVNRMGDKLIVGLNGNVNDGNIPEVAKDWLETLFPNTTSITAISALSQIAGIGVVAATRTSDGAANGYGIGNAGFCVNNFSTTGNTACAGGYFESLHPTGAYGANFTHGVEINIDEMNSGTVNGVTFPVHYQPYTSPFPGGLTDALRLASGGVRGGAQPATDAIAIINNGATFRSGIVFMQNSITGTDGVTGTGEAIALAKGHVINWYSPDGNANSSITGVGASGTSTSTIQIGAGAMTLFSTGQATVNVNSAAGSFAAIVGFNNGSNAYNVGIDGTGNNFIISNNIGGNAFSVVSGNATMGAAGTTTQLLGAVKIGTATSWTANGSVATALTSVGPAGSHTTVQEWLTFSNSSGVVRYIPVF